MLASHWLAQDSLVQNLDYFGENKLFSKKKKNVNILLLVELSKVLLQIDSKEMVYFFSDSVMSYFMSWYNATLFHSGVNIVLENN